MFPFYPHLSKLCVRKFFNALQWIEQPLFGVVSQLRCNPFLKVIKDDNSAKHHHTAPVALMFQICPSGFRKSKLFVLEEETSTDSID